MPAGGAMTLAAIDSASLGLAAAGAAAVLWACSTMLYGKAAVRVSAAMLNFIKGLLAVALFAATLALLGRPLVAPLLESATWPIAMLALSGIIGIGVGDTAYFACLRNLGPRQASLLSLLAVPAAAAGALLVLNERMPPAAWLGIAITLAGIAWVVSERRAPPRDLAAKVAPHHVLAGVLLGLAAAICQAGGALMNRHALKTEGELDVLWTATWRLAAGTAVLAVWAPLMPRPQISAGDLTLASPGAPPAGAPTAQPAAPRRPAFWRYLIPAMLMGTYGGIWLQQEALARADAAYVQTLLSTTPVWVLPLAALAGERISARAVAGSLVAVAGVVLLVFAQRG